MKSTRITLKEVEKVARQIIFQDSYGGGYCLYDNKSFGSLQELWGYIQTTEAPEGVPVTACSAVE